MLYTRMLKPFPLHPNLPLEGGGQAQNPRDERPPYSATSAGPPQRGRERPQHHGFQIFGHRSQHSAPPSRAGRRRRRWRREEAARQGWWCWRRQCRRVGVVAQRSTTETSSSPRRTSHGYKVTNHPAPRPNTHTTLHAHTNTNTNTRACPLSGTVFKQSSAPEGEGRGDYDESQLKPILTSGEAVGSLPVSCSPLQLALRALTEALALGDPNKVQHMYTSPKLLPSSLLYE